VTIQIHIDGNRFATCLKMINYPDQDYRLTKPFLYLQYGNIDTGSPEIWIKFIF